MKNLIKIAGKICLIPALICFIFPQKAAASDTSQKAFGLQCNEIISHYLKTVQSSVTVKVSDSASSIPDAPQHLKAHFRHKGVYSLNKDHLEITFDPIPEAKQYEIWISTDNTFHDPHTYFTDVSTLLIYPETDRYITGCVRGYSVKVRAVYASGKTSDWSTPAVISCNQAFHFHS